MSPDRLAQPGYRYRENVLETVDGLGIADVIISVRGTGVPLVIHREQQSQISLPIVELLNSVDATRTGSSHRKRLTMLAVESKATVCRSRARFWRGPGDQRISLQIGFFTAGRLADSVPRRRVGCPKLYASLGAQSGRSL